MKTLILISAGEEVYLLKMASLETHVCIFSEPATVENGDTSMDVDEVESSPEELNKTEKNGIGSRLDSFK